MKLSNTAGNTWRSIISDFFSDVVMITKNSINDLETTLSDAFKSQLDLLRHRLIFMVLEGMFYAVGALVVIAGIIVLLSRFISIEYVLLGVGVLMLIAGIIFGFTRK